MNGVLARRLAMLVEPGRFELLTAVWLDVEVTVPSRLAGGNYQGNPYIAVLRGGDSVLCVPELGSGTKKVGR